MKTLFYTKPVQMPTLHPNTSDKQIRGANQLCRRAAELINAAALIDGTEPGLLTQKDIDKARRRGAACIKRLLIAGFPKGKPHIAYYRALTGEGLRQSADAIARCDKLWILDDLYGLADSYLRAAADEALQNGAETIMCPSPLRRDRMEAVFLPGVKAAFLSKRAAEHLNTAGAVHVRLDRIPDAERRAAFRASLRDHQKMIRLLVDRAALYMANAQILCEMDPITCAD